MYDGIGCEKCGGCYCHCGEVEEQKEESKGDASPSTPTVEVEKDIQVEDAPERIWIDGPKVDSTRYLYSCPAPSDLITVVACIEYIRADLASTSDAPVDDCQDSSVEDRLCIRCHCLASRSRMEYCASCGCKCEYLPVPIQPRFTDTGQELAVCKHCGHELIALSEPPYPRNWVHRNPHRHYPVNCQLETRAEPSTFDENISAEAADAYLRGEGIIKKCEVCGQDAMLTNDLVTCLIKRHSEVAVELDKYKAASTSDWQDISTAPKDGTLFLAWVIDEDGDGQVRFVSWGKTSHVPIYGFCLRDQGAEDSNICNPTLWQPMPDPPSVSKPAPATASARLSNDTEEGPASSLPSSDQKVGE